MTVTLALPPENPPREETDHIGPQSADRRESGKSFTGRCDRPPDGCDGQGVVIIGVEASGYRRQLRFPSGRHRAPVNGAAINRVGDLTRALNGANQLGPGGGAGRPELKLSVDG